MLLHNDGHNNASTLLNETIIFFPTCFYVSTAVCCLVLDSGLSSCFCAGSLLHYLSRLMDSPKPTAVLRCWCRVVEVLAPLEVAFHHILQFTQVLFVAIQNLPGHPESLHITAFVGSLEAVKYYEQGTKGNTAGTRMHVRTAHASRMPQIFLRCYESLDLWVHASCCTRPAVRNTGQLQMGALYFQSQTRNKTIYWLQYIIDMWYPQCPRTLPATLRSTSTSHWYDVRNSRNFR